MSTLITIIGKHNVSRPLSATGEADLIRAAQSGDQDAMLELMRQYGPVLRRLLWTFKDAIGEEDAEQTLMLAFTQLVKDHDVEASPRITLSVKNQLRVALVNEAATAASGFTIPWRTMARYVAIMKRAEQDIKLAREIAPDHGMTRTTFDAVVRANRTDAGAMLDEDGEGTRSTYDAGIDVTKLVEYNDEEESEELVEFVMSTISDDPEMVDVVEHAYGFRATEVDGVTMFPEGLAPLPDGVVGAALGLSRQTTQRRRTAALGRMREALALDGTIPATFAAEEG